MSYTLREVTLLTSVEGRHALGSLVSRLIKPAAFIDDRTNLHPLLPTKPPNVPVPVPVPVTTSSSDDGAMALRFRWSLLAALLGIEHDTVEYGTRTNVGGLGISNDCSQMIS